MVMQDVYNKETVYGTSLYSLCYVSVHLKLYLHQLSFENQIFPFTVIMLY